MDGFNSKLGTAEERINEMKDRSGKTHTKIQKDKNKKLKRESILRDMWKWSNMHITGV